MNKFAIGMGAMGALFGGAVGYVNQDEDATTGAKAAGFISGATAGGLIGLGTGFGLGFNKNFKAGRAAASALNADDIGKTMLEQMKDGKKAAAAGLDFFDNVKSNIGQRGYIGASLYAGGYSVEGGSGMGKAILNKGRDAKAGIFGSKVDPTTLPREVQKSMSPLNRWNMGWGGLTVGIAATTGAISLASNTAAYSSQGHPVNAYSSTMGAVAKRQRLAAYQQRQNLMAKADMVSMSNPYAVGQRDTTRVYSPGSGLQGSAVPYSRNQANRANKRIRAGQYGDGGDLVFALNTLRNG